MSFGTTRAGKALFAVALGLLFLSAAPGAAAQPQEAKPAPAPAASAQKPPAGQKNWSVRMSKTAPHTFTVKAKEASLSEITTELGSLLKIPFHLSPVMAKQRVSVDFAGLTLDAALRSLAPHPYIDYVAGGDDGNPRPLAVYLHAINEPAPSLTATVQGGSEAILFEGDTEEGVGDAEAQRKREEESPLRVAYTHNQLTVKARKQPLTVVLYKVASEMGIPFDMRWEPSNLVDIDISSYPLEQAARTISPGVRLYYRLDAVTYQLLPLRLALVQPTQTGAQ
jgi:hypothetical protein